MTVNTQELREAAEAFKQACDEGLFETEFGTWQALSHEFDQQVSHTVVIALLDEIDALREALEWYAGMAKRMGNAALHGDSQSILALMKEVAVDYGGRARAALNPPAPPQGETA